MGASAARLEVVTGKAAGTPIIVDSELIIGRHAEGVGRLAEDEEISRSHARISVDSTGSCAIEDLGSTNGTFVNGIRIVAPQTLSEGDTIEVGDTTLIVRELPGSHEPADAEAPSETVQGTGAEAPSDPVQPTASHPAPPGPEPAAPEPPEDPDTAVKPPALPSLRIEVDFAAGELRIGSEDASEPLQLVFDGDVWRPAPSQSNEKGTST